MSHSPSSSISGTPITVPPDAAEVLRLFPGPTVRLAVEKVYRDISFPTHQRRPYVVINMVASLDGKVAVKGKTSSIGSPTDRVLMCTVRAHADAVMIGAGTLRAEKLRLDVPKNLLRSRASRDLKPQPLAVVATKTGDLPLQTNLLNSSPDNLLILASPETPRGRLSELSSRFLLETPPDLKVGLETLKDRYAVDVVLVEGGPTLNHALISAGLVDELFLTLAPNLLGGLRPDAPTMLEGLEVSPQKSPRPELASVHFSDGELFLRYILHPPGQHFEY